MKISMIKENRVIVRRLIKKSFEDAVVDVFRAMIEAVRLCYSPQPMIECGSGLHNPN
jgi:hypothetical protein